MSYWNHLPEHEPPVRETLYWVTVENANFDRSVKSARWDLRWHVWNERFNEYQRLRKDQRVLAWLKKTPDPEPFTGEVPK